MSRSNWAKALLPAVRIALGIRDPAFPQTGGFPPVDLYTISPDGTVVFEQKDIYLFPPL
jgi:hypothetical protein